MGRRVERFRRSQFADDLKLAGVLALGAAALFVADLYGSGVIR